MNADYNDLKQLQISSGYRKLQALWVHEYALIMQALKNAGKKGLESAWRFHAGRLEGADLMTGQLERALLQMEKEGEGDNPGTKTAEEILKEIRGD